VLIVEGEWGRVEEITATNVVLKIWDERRAASLLGTVFLWVDYSLPMQPVRAEARRLCEASANWDGRVCNVQVTDSSERAMQLRILVSSADSGRAFDLRCEMREGLVDFIQRQFPLALPRMRADVAARPDDSTRRERTPESA
jgi:hypothetical protein